MRILFVTPYPPSPVRVRSLGFVQQLRKNHDVHVLTLCTNQRQRADVEALESQGISVNAIYESRLSKALRCAGAYSTAQPLQVAFDASPRMRAALRLYLASGKYHLLHLESVRTLGILPVLPSRLPIPCVWDAVDCMSELYAQGAAHKATPMMRLVGEHEAERLRSYERAYLHSFRHVLVTSQWDRKALLRIADEELCLPPGRIPKPPTRPCAEVTVLPHGVDTSSFQPAEPREPDTLVFSGKMSFHVNMAAVRCLVQSIMPLVWQQRPNVRLVIAGSDPPASIRSFANDPRIQVTGHLPDLRSIIARSQVAVCPLPYAVGIQNKMLEAMALGTPVVTSSCAAAGLHPDAMNNVFIADSKQDFARAVLTLLDSQKVWQIFAQRGEAYVARYHSWDTILQQLEAVYDRAIEVGGKLECKTETRIDVL